MLFFLKNAFRRNLKSMPRYPRNFIKTSYFHVMTQGINKSYIFEKGEDIKYYIKIMYELKKEYNIKIIAYCIMNNHAHILIQTEDVKELSKYMQRLNIKYGKYYNKKYKRVGYVFRDRYRSEGIYNEEHLYNCINYIYENPVKAGICDVASKYPYSNYKKTEIEKNGNYVFIDIEEEQARDYREYIKEYLKRKNVEFYELNNNKNLLKELINTLYSKYRLSLRKIAEETNIARETIRKIYNE